MTNIWKLALIFVLGYIFGMLLVTAAHGQSLPDAPMPNYPKLEQQNGASLTPLTWKKTFNWEYFTVIGIHFAAMMKDQNDTLRGEKMGCALESDDRGAYFATRGDLS